MQLTSTRLLMLATGMILGAVGGSRLLVPRLRARRRRLDELTKDELYDLARERDVEGRSGMSKDELIEALQAR